MNRGDVFDEVKHQAVMYREWKRMAKNAPLYLSFRLEVSKAKMRMMTAAAEYRVFCCRECRYWNGEGK
jgi:hypothetical protein